MTRNDSTADHASVATLLICYQRAVSHKRSLCYTSSVSCSYVIEYKTGLYFRLLHCIVLVCLYIATGAHRGNTSTHLPHGLNLVLRSVYNTVLIIIDHGITLTALTKLVHSWIIYGTYWVRHSYKYTLREHTFSCFLNGALRPFNVTFPQFSNTS